MRKNPDAFVYLGDNVYGDSRDVQVLQSRYKRLAAKALFQQLRRSMPVFAVWDDHDYGENDAGKRYPLKQESKEIFLDFWKEPQDSARRQREGIYASQMLGEPGRQLQLILLDQRWFKEEPVHGWFWQQIKEQQQCQARSRKLAENLTVKQCARRCRRLGNKCRFFQVSPQKGVCKAVFTVSADCPEGWVRSKDNFYELFPDFQPTMDASRTILGQAQWRWLEAELRKPAQLRVIASSQQFAAEHNGWEAWANFPYEQLRMVELIRKTKAAGVMMISGDVHYGEISKLETITPRADSDDPVFPFSVVSAIGYSIYDVTSSGLTQTWRNIGSNRYRIGRPERGRNFGFIDIDWAAADPQIRLAIVDRKRQISVEHQLGLSELQPPVNLKTEEDSTGAEPLPAKGEQVLPGQ